MPSRTARKRVNSCIPFVRAGSRRSCAKSRRTRTAPIAPAMTGSPSSPLPCALISMTRRATDPHRLRGLHGEVAQRAPSIAIRGRTGRSSASARRAASDRYDHVRLRAVLSVVGPSVRMTPPLGNTLHHLETGQFAELERQQAELLLDRWRSERDACQHLADDRIGIDRERVSGTSTLISIVRSWTGPPTACASSDHRCSATPFLLAGAADEKPDAAGQTESFLALRLVKSGWLFVKADRFKLL